ncbi:MAG: hypothetical protein CVU13_05445 [Bacteroidetes bacterium HGW-Bacteroidetes-8]|jgi:MFS family permease|nr:MAG: hypothetical protein CVU13_05445 [Bacteroidetes bacterium HGW-Bacteroidetes-8]
MELRKFRQIDNIIGAALLLVASFVYLSTIEPTTSFWDCGEFIASSYKLEIGHPPGNPVFQLIARFFTLFAGAEKAAMMVNAMSALCSAFTILFLFWTITHLGRRILEKSGSALTLNSAIAVWGSGALGALAYTFSDTFWFSAVEGEVYAMSSLFTAAVFWAMLKWEEQANEPYANRWIVLIAFLMGLSIGVHLLNLLTIPALVFIYYYKKFEVTTKRSIVVLGISVVILALILYGIIPYLPKVAAIFDLLFVNVFGFPFNIGAAIFVALLLALCFYLIWWSFKNGKVLLNTIVLSFTMIVIGYSAYAVIIIRSSANTPTNENQPDNPFSLVRYLGREQYGSNPLIYGETFASTYELTTNDYWAKDGDKYRRVKGPVTPIYDSGTKMLFPRMWSTSSSHIKFYEQYTQGRGKSINGSQYKMPLFKDNLAYFFNYQLDWMYLRYFMWNFAGRQNDLHSTTPGDPFQGNWESGIGFIDKMRLGDQSKGPDYLLKNRAKNHLYMLPLLLGIVGLLFQLKKDKQNWWVTMLLFLLTGLAIVVYLNQPPYQPRERDYAYAGSFYVFTIWIGLAVMAIHDFLKRWVPERYSAIAVSLVTLAVPFQMASQNWDDHDRSNRYTARDLAYNYLSTCSEQAILVTHGDNDTFPLWYLQEVEEVRTDVRIMNTSLLGTDWYIDQMQYRVYESDPVKFSIPRSEYLYGTNDMVQIVERVNEPVSLKAVINLISNPEAKVKLSSGEFVSFFPARELLIPVDKKRVLASGIVAEADSSLIVDTIKLSIPQKKNVMLKSELMILDMLANYNWERPIYFIAMGGDLEIGISDYLEFNGFAYKFVPIKNKTSLGNPGRFNALQMYDNIMNTYRWGNMENPSVNIDYQNLLTFNAVLAVRNIHSQTAKALLEQGETKKAVEVLDKMQEIMIPSQFPLNGSLLNSLNEYSVMESINTYLLAGEKEKAIALADAFIEETLKSIDLFSTKYRGKFLSMRDIENNLSYLFYIADIYKNRGMEERAKELEKSVEDMINRLQGS